jgi:hypothetical protein
MKFSACMVFSFISFLHVLLVPFSSLHIWFTFCILSFNFVNYVFYCYFMYSYCYMYVWDAVGLFVMTIKANTYTICINVKKSYRVAKFKLVFSRQNTIRWFRPVLTAPFRAADRE